jgi:hypothetical protein
LKQTGSGTWNFINESQTNQWTEGSATSLPGGGKSVYISNNGTDNTYTTNSPSLVHLFKDIYFPPSDEDYTLSFDWKGNGEVNKDDMKVYLTDISAVPAAGIALSDTEFETYSGSYTWQHEEITLLRSTYSGKDKRLVFSWRNDNSGGLQPPAAIDSISQNCRGLCYFGTVSSFRFLFEIIPIFALKKKQ